jgi:hypothetical protein
MSNDEKRDEVHIEQHEGSGDVVVNPDDVPEPDDGGSPEGVETPSDREERAVDHLDRKQ